MPEKGYETPDTAAQSKKRNHDDEQFKKWMEDTYGVTFIDCTPKKEDKS